ncbi:tautomerase family protein [Bradyrhizobium yuanmingense]|uniref:tautomerase family protein n=1 Tax=Bradyrhizobium yuanmingense TaxID=108015 RepID=UPI0023BA2FF8|nr:tautomerase family protein [Bradyrhizobium yuanmingense]MDF0518682.1 tautomerase family protein [Bradyrhizobium yuanmingense]
MPIYIITSQRGTISSEQKYELAEALVEMHLRVAGGARWLVNVVFQESESIFVGGAPAKRLLIATTIREGRNDEAKAKLLAEYSSLVSRVLDVPTSDIIAGLDEVNPDNVMEAGFILPKVGEEEAWMKKVLASQRH